MNRQHNYGLAIVGAMVVSCVWLLRFDHTGQSLTLVIQLAATIGGGIIGNAMRSGPPGGPGAVA